MIDKELKEKLLSLQQQINELVTQFIINEEVQQVEAAYLSEGNTRILIVIPTEKKLEKFPENVQNVIVPTGCQVKYYNVHGLPVAEAYINAAKQALADNADFMLTIEDDTFPPEDALYKLLSLLREKNEKNISAVGAWYPKKNKVKEGVHIAIKDNRRTELIPDGNLHEVYTLAMGCTLYKVDMFKYMSEPYFATTDNLTQDSFFSQKARMLGHKLYCDTSIRCKHIDRVTGEVFE